MKNRTLFNASLVGALTMSVMSPVVLAEVSDNEPAKTFDITNSKRLDSNTSVQVKPVVDIGKNQELVTLGIEGGSLSLQIPSNPTIERVPVKLVDDVMLVNIPFDNKVFVTDSRGTKEGWNLSIKSTKFAQVPKENGTTPKSGWHSLPIGSVKLTASPSVQSLSNTFEAIEPDTIRMVEGESVAIDNNGVILVSAYKDEGAGAWEITLPEGSIGIELSKGMLRQDKVNYPNSPTPYSTIITWDLVTGPGN